MVGILACRGDRRPSPTDHRGQNHMQPDKKQRRLSFCRPVSTDRVSGVHGSKTSFVNCPICARSVPGLTINFHVDECLLLSSLQQAESNASPERPSNRSSGATGHQAEGGPSTDKEAPFTTPKALDHEGNVPPRVAPNRPLINTYHIHHDDLILTCSGGPHRCESVGRRGAIIPLSSLVRPFPKISLRDLPGQWLFDDFITAEEEAIILHMLDTKPPGWVDKTFNGRQR